MTIDGCRALLAFYNQTHHAMTMAAAISASRGSFKIDERLAGNMLGNVEKVIRSSEGLPQGQEIVAAWKKMEKWLRERIRGTAGLDHGAMLYESGALAYLTWTKLCAHPSAKQCAEEYYTVIEHPDRHPGIGAIKSMWSNGGRGERQDLPATLPNIAALIAKGTDPQGQPAGQ